MNNSEHNIQPNNEVLVKVEGLSKKFCKDLKTSLWYGVKDLVSGVGGNKHERILRPKEFWAVKDVNFELRRGECLGLIGHNGAGKSTLLKILNGLINPDAGKVTMKGRVGALIELGAGFNPVLTGRENIYNNGAILGFTKKEINTKLEAIIAFAELEEFIDMPVQHYSSGMKVRLGFAVAAQMEPDVLIIDEVLAVGDLGFVLKCYKTIDTILPKTAMVFVSHSMPMISRICNEVILMEHGEVSYYGNDVAKGIDLYYGGFMGENSNVVFSDGKYELVEVRINNNENSDLAILNWKDNLELYLKFRVKGEESSSALFLITIYDKEQRPVAMLNENEDYFRPQIKNGYCEFIIKHDSLQLSKGFYTINISVVKGKTKEPMLRVNGVLQFQVTHHNEIWPPFMLDSKFESIK